MIPKKSKYRSVIIKKKRYYFYKITWLDITGDSGHATSHEFSGMMPCVMVTNAYVYVFPRGCITKMEKVLM